MRLNYERIDFYVEQGTVPCLAKVNCIKAKHESHRVIEANPKD